MRVLLLLITILVSSQSHAKSIYLARHAEKQVGSNPSLTTEGKNRAKQLAYLLEHVNIKHVYSTQYLRTEETAQPTADLHSVPIKSYDPRQLSGFAEQLKTLDGHILVIGHSNTTPQLVSLLTGQKLNDLSEHEYGDVFQVNIGKENISYQHFQIPPHSDETGPVKESIQDVLNFVKVSDKLHTAGQPSENVLTFLADENYDLVINLAPAQSQGSLLNEGGLVSKAGASYVNIPVKWKNPTEQEFELFSRVLGNDHVKKALVHCQMNMRASAFTFLYQVIHEKVPPEDAFKSLKKVWVPNDQWHDFVQRILDKNNIDFNIADQKG